MAVQIRLTKINETILKKRAKQDDRSVAWIANCAIAYAFEVGKSNRRKTGLTNEALDVIGKNIFDNL